MILVLSVLVAVSLGPWVLLIGLMRYLFVLAGSRYPWLVGPLPPSRARKVVAAVQGVVLVAATLAGLPPSVADGRGARRRWLSLLWSFGRDTLWLASHTR